MFHPEQINWLAVVAAAVSRMVIGFLWYGPIFGNTWMTALGRTREEIGGANSSYAVAAGSSLVMAAAFALLLTIGTGVTLVSGIVWGLVLAIGFAVTSTLTAAAFENRNWTVVGLSVGYDVISLVVMGAILGAWR